MIRLFKEGNGFIQLIVVAVIGSLPYVLLNQDMRIEGSWCSGSPLSMLHFGIPQRPFSWIISILLLVSAAVLLNLVSRQYKLVGYKSGMPSLMLVLLLSIVFRGQYQPDLILAVIVVTICLSQLMSIPESGEGYQELFLTSFLVAIAGFLVWPLLFSAIFLFGFLLIYRVYGWRYWLIIISGQLVAHLFLFTWYFWFDKLPTLQAFYFDSIRQFIPELPEGGILMILAPLLILLLGIQSSGSNILRLSDRKILMRGHIQLLVWLFVFLTLAALASPTPYFAAAALIALPIGVLSAMRLDESRRSPLTAAFLVVIVIAYAGSFFI